MAAVFIDERWRDEGAVIPDKVPIAIEHNSTLRELLDLKRELLKVSERS
jgi:hypothetical protein